MKKFLIFLLVIAVVIGAFFYFNKQSQVDIPDIHGGQVDNLDSEDFSKAIQLDNLKAGDTVSFPLTITGKATGLYFEGSFPVAITDKEGNQLAIKPAQALSDWMTSGPVPFTITFDSVDTLGSTEGYIVFMADNPSGLPENEHKYPLPVKFAPVANTGTTTLKVFFPNSEKDPNAFDCSKVYAVTRTIPKTTGVARAAIIALLKGPTDSESNAGYFTNIPDGVVLNNISITEGVAYVDLSDIANGGSCRVTSIRAEIESTLKQFSTIKSVVISINGETDDVLQP